MERTTPTVQGYSTNRFELKEHIGIATKQFKMEVDTFMADPDEKEVVVAVFCTIATQMAQELVYETTGILLLV